MKTTMPQIAGRRADLFVGGDWRKPATGRYFASYDPSAGAPWYEAADGDADDVDAAVSAAADAIQNPAWRDITQTRRGDLIRRLAELIDANQEPLAQLETRDNGKIIGETRAQMNYLPQYFTYFAGRALARHPGIAKLAFTGGADTGREVAAHAAANLVPCSLELGGKSPHVIFDDADPARAVNGVVAGVFAAAGQTCVAGSRCFVHARVYDDIVAQVAARARTVRIGHPADDATQLGPLALRAQREKVERYVQHGLDEGAKLAAGGGRPGIEGDGWYFQPTVFSDARNDMKIARDEIFGPVVCMIRFSDEADLIAQANDSVYGLAAGVWTRDIDRALRFARAVEAGTVWVNTYRSASFVSPAGGFKSSGYGKHNGVEAMREFTRVKSVVIDHSGRDRDAFVIQLK